MDLYKSNQIKQYINIDIINNIINKIKNTKR